MPENMSFLPEDYLEKRIARRTNIICMVLFAVVIGGVVAAFLVTDRQRSEIEAQQQAVNERFAEAARRLDQLEQLQAQKHQMMLKAKVASVLVERVPRTLVLAEVVNHMPATLSLTEFELDSKVLKRAAPIRTAMQRARRKAKEDAKPRIQAPQTEVSIRMQGMAPTDVEVAQFITALSNHPLFHNVTLQYSEATTIEDRDMREFAIELMLSQNVNLSKIEPTRIARDLKTDPMGDTVQIAPALPIIPAADHSE